MNMTKVVHGKINGRTIELSEDLGLAPGEEVEVQIKTLPPPQVWGEGLKRCAGALADDPEWDSIMEQTYRERKMERRPIVDDE
jgi:hypothetical protein